MRFVSDNSNVQFSLLRLTQDNLVFSSQYLDGLQAMLDQLQCLYCEKTFPSHAVLRGHMRKKHHFKINPKNKAWDVHYIVNFLVCLVKSCNFRVRRRYII